jgi:hypothetical protein
MSSTPEKMPGSGPHKTDVAPGQSPDGDEQHMDREGADAQAQGLGYEFEVKEQDRWLPIANGAYTIPCPLLLFDLRSASLPSARRRIATPAVLDAYVFQSRA